MQSVQYKMTKQKSKYLRIYSFSSTLGQIIVLPKHCLSGMFLVPQCIVITFSFGSYFQVSLLHKSTPELLTSS